LYDKVIDVEDISIPANETEIKYTHPIDANDVIDSREKFYSTHLENINTKFNYWLENYNGVEM